MVSKRIQEEASIIDNRNYRGDYYQITLSAPAISPHVQPGQFAHLKLPDQAGILLRRPFSIYDADTDTISIIYKTVGKGTELLSRLPSGSTISILAPLGNGFPAPGPGRRVIIVAGGYGCAATYLIAKRNDNPGICMIGGRSAADILLDDEFEKAGYEVQVSTNDGSRGTHGLVTVLLEKALKDRDTDTVVYACGPNAMLKAVGQMCIEQSVEAFLSVDEHMCCGVGACFTCVVKIKADNPDGWEYVRSCKDGPVFRATDICWDD